MNLGEAATHAKSWRHATALSGAADWFTHPLLGVPWDHHCDRLRSVRLSVSVVIPTWNAVASIRYCLEALRLSSFHRLAPERFEVIVCDDGSADDSWEQILDAGQNLPLRAYRLAHRGQSAALNYALDRAEGDVVLFCDADMMLGCGAVDELVSRHEAWDDAVCFGFRSHIAQVDLPPANGEMIWPVLHTEAFSADNRVRFDVPTVVPNMLLATSWLDRLSDGRALIDSEGTRWRRHRFVFGCLFSARRALLRDCDGFPDALSGWGYGDTLVAARLEAAGAFILPVVSAWGHHIQHDLRHPDQWFQGARNALAYEFLLTTAPGRALWRGVGSGREIDRFSSRSAALPPDVRPLPVDITPAALLGLGRCDECLAMLAPSSEPASVTECLFRLGRYADAMASGGGTTSLWGALSWYRAGQAKRANQILQEAADADPCCAYAATTSAAELSFFVRYYHVIGLPEIAQIYEDVSALRGLPIWSS